METFKGRLEDTGETAKGFHSVALGFIVSGHSGCSYENERDAGWKTGSRSGAPAEVQVTNDGSWAAPWGGKGVNRFERF